VKLLFLGSGSAFTVGNHNYHSNMILEDSNNKRLLIDCGSDARLSLHAAGLSHSDITDVYISHLHADHAGGLEWLAFTKKFQSAPSSEKPNLHISEHLVDLLWNHVLSGGLMSLDDRVAELSTYFNVNPIPEKSSFRWQNIDIHLIKTIHTYNGDSLVPSYGLMFKSNGITCLITTDTRFAPDYWMEFYNKADIIFHDCETTKNASGVHSHFNQLMTLDSTIKSKMWLYHYNPCPKPDAIAAGFQGFVIPGQCFDFEDKETLFNKS
jgi:ribonuclease BN (tRNA processing enzyme)